MKISKTLLILFMIILLAGILRAIAALSVDIGTDEMIYTVLPFNIISAHRLSTIEQAPIYFYLVDIGYKMTGGLSLLSGRLPNIFFGALASIVIFLISLELFSNKKAALLTAFFFAISGYAIRYSQEMDMTAYFLVLLSIFFFIRVLKWQHQNLYASTLFLALAVLVKPIVLLFLPAYAITWLWQGWKLKNGIIHKEENKLKIDRKILRTLGYCIFLIILIISPVLIYNYLLYQDKGFTDYYFSTLAGIGDQGPYAGQEGTAWTWSELAGITKIIFTSIFHFDWLLLIFGMIGLWFSFKKDKYSSSYLILTAILLLFYLAGKTASSSHYLWLPLILSIFAGYGTMKISDLIREKIKFNHIISIIIIIALVSTAMVIKQIIPLKEQSIAIALHDYADKNIPENAVVVLDPRIYRGIYAWAFPNLHYLEGTYFPDVTNNLKKIPGNTVSIPIYYIECGPGTYCGWKPEDFERITPFAQQLSSFFHQQTQKIAEIKAIDTFYVYSGQMTLPTGVYETIDRTHSFWYTPVGWKYPELAPDYYILTSPIDKIMQSVGFFILYLDVAIALLSAGLVFYLLGRQSD